MRGKKFWAWLLTAALLLGMLPAPAMAADTFGDFEYSVNNDTVTITKYTGSGSDIVIPSDIEGKKVTAIGGEAFYDNSALKSVVIPDGVTSIGVQAFNYCSALESVEIPGSVTSIEAIAFYGCTSLAEITLPNSVTTIGDAAFSFCSLLASIEIPDGVETIGGGAFSHCNSLASITIPDSVTSIGGAAFDSCEELRSVKILGRVTTIGDHTFTNCHKLTEVTIPDSVKTIESNAFDNCCALRSIKLPNGVETIGDMAFYDCKSLESITIPESVTTIGGGAFQGCTVLAEITIPDSVKTIGESAFSDCSKLTQITIPDGVKTIGVNMFNSCDALESVKIPDSVTSIGSAAFHSCTALRSIEIPYRVTSIGYQAFVNCPALNLIVLPEGCHTEQAWIPGEATQMKYTVDGGTVTITSITPGSNQLDAALLPTTIGGKPFTVENCGHNFGSSYVDKEDGRTHIKKCALCKETFGDSEQHIGDGTCWACGGKIAAAVTITWETQEPLTYTGQPAAITPPTVAPENAAGSIRYSYEKDGSFTDGLPVDAGTYTLRAAVDGSVDYMAASEDTTLTIEKAGNSITSLTCNDIVFGGTPAPSATASFGTPNTYTYSDSESGTYGGWNTQNSKGTWYVKASVDGTDNYEGAEKVISFLVTAEREPTPNAGINYSDETLTGLTARANYSITPAGGAAVAVNASEGGTVDIREDWFGKTLSIVRTARDDNYSDSEAQSLSIPARPAAPTTPMTLTKTANSIEITNSYSGCEFSVDGTNWQPAGIFTGLTAGTEYTVQVRYTAKDVRQKFRSDSMKQTVTTMAADGSATVKPGESVTTGGTTITNDGSTTTIVSGGTTTTVTPGNNVAVNGDGAVTVPGGSTVQTGNGPEITLPSGGTVGDDGGVTVPNGGSVQVGDTTVTLPSGGTVSGDGGVTVPDGGSIQVGDTTITPPNGGEVKPTGGSVTVPGGSTVQTGSGPEITVGPGNGGTVGGDGGVTVPSGGSVQVGDTTITLPSGGGTVTPAPGGNVTAPGGSTVTKGDGTTTEVPSGGGSVDPDTGEVTLNTHTVTFDSQGGSAVPRAIVTHGGKLSAPANPTRSGYTFGGWYKESACTTAWNFDTDVVTGNITLYAKWTAKPTSGGSSGGGGYTPPAYPPTVERPGEGGTVTVSPSRPSAGDKVTIRPKPNNGYEVDKITVTDRNGKPVTVTKNQDGTYSFTQPNGTVKVEVSYKTTETKPADIPWTNSYWDISENVWYYDAVRYVSVNGLMGGYGDGRFGPNDDLTRAQLAQILHNREGKPGANYLLQFDDVASGEWYTEAIRWAASNGIVGGYGDGHFGPNDNITREQLAVMLWRYAGSPAVTGKELHFTDTDKISRYALDAMRWAVENGIINGYGNGQLGPNGPATRAQIAQVLMNFFENQ